MINRLIVKVSHKNEKALEELFHLTKEKLFYLACKYLNDKSLAEDVLLEVYSKVYEKAYTFDRKQNGFNWLHTIVKNKALDFNRTHCKNDDLEFNEEFYISNVEDSSPRLKNLKVALKYLTPNERRIIVLKFWENTTLKDIADKLNMPLSSLHRRYVQILHKLYKILSNLERGDNHEDK